MDEAKGAAGPRYQWLLIALLSINFGIVFLDRNAFSFLTPFIQPELKLSNSQIGQIAGALSFSWAIAGLMVGRISDRIGRRKPILVAATIVFSLASGLSGLAGTFIGLLAARLLMGLAEGGIMPISQALIATEVSHERRGLAQGVTQNFGANLIANFAGPVVIVAIAVSVGWRNAFYLAALPGLLMALLIVLLVREPAMPPRPKREKQQGGAGLLLKDPNMLLCIPISTLLVAYFLVFTSFIPLYLVQSRGISGTDMSYIMAAFGLTSMAYSFLVPGSSDKIGRKPAIFLFALVGVLIPAGALAGGGFWSLFICFGLGAAISGTFPIAMATIPSEIAEPRLTATALSLTMGISEIIGGVFAPVLAGRMADAIGMDSLLWALAGLAVAIALLALGLRETAPAALRRRQPAVAV